MFVCGYRAIRARDEARDRPVAMDVWYPAASPDGEVPHDYGLGAGSIAEGAEAAGGPFPVILLSHGAFGSARNYAWIAEHLARRGHVVCGVSHFGESYVYGAETIDPTVAADVGSRALDCSFALDHLLAAVLVDERDRDRQKPAVVICDPFVTCRRGGSRYEQRERSWGWTDDGRWGICF